MKEEIKQNIILLDKLTCGQMVLCGSIAEYLLGWTNECHFSDIDVIIPDSQIMYNIEGKIGEHQWKVKDSYLLQSLFDNKERWVIHLGKKLKTSFDVYIKPLDPYQIVRIDNYPVKVQEAEFRKKHLHDLVSRVDDNVDTSFFNKMRYKQQTYA